MPAGLSLPRPLSRACGQCPLCVFRVLTCPPLCATLAGAELQARGQGGAQRPEAGGSGEARRSGVGVGLPESGRRVGGVAGVGGSLGT